MFIKNSFTIASYVHSKFLFHKKRLKKWLGREDSNLRMPAPKAGALPLGDAPPKQRMYNVQPYLIQHYSAKEQKYEKFIH